MLVLPRRPADLRFRDRQVGVAVLALLALNACAGLVRPGKDAAIRPAFNLGHALLGYGVIALAAVATRSGIHKAHELGYLAEASWYDAQIAILAVAGAIWTACVLLWLFGVARARPAAAVREKDDGVELTEADGASPKKSFC